MKFNDEAKIKKRKTSGGTELISFYIFWTCSNNCWMDENLKKWNFYQYIHLPSTQPIDSIPGMEQSSQNPIERTTFHKNHITHPIDNQISNFKWWLVAIAITKKYTQDTHHLLGRILNAWKKWFRKKSPTQPTERCNWSWPKTMIRMDFNLN